MKKLNKAVVRQIKVLSRDKKVRDKENLFVAEGAKLINDAIDKNLRIKLLVVSTAFLKKVSNKKYVGSLETSGISVYKLPEAEFDKLSNLKTSQGILALIQKQSQGKIEYDKNSFFVVLDGVQDPGNTGAIIRTAVAFGASGIILTGESVDIYNPKVIRATSGMILDIPVYRCSEDDIDSLKEQGCKVFVSDTHGCEIDKLNNVTTPFLIVFGSEGRGASKAIREKADDVFYVPINKRVESLNVSCACAVSLFVFSGKIATK